MNPDHTRYAQWDAAYVLGALSAGDRREYEEHVSACDECRRAVAELTPTVGLLSRLSASDVALLDDAGPDASTRAGFVSLARERALRRRRAWWAGAAAAVVLVVAAVAVPLAVSNANRPTVSFALETTTDVALEASVRLTSVGWGTRIELDCRYPDAYVADVPEGGWTYALALIDADGVETTVSTWRAWPGSSARVSAGTALTVDDLRAVEIRSAKGAVLMRHDL